MDMSNIRLTRGASGAADDPTMESGDWRAKLHREMTVNKIMDTLKRYLPFPGHERLQELKKIAKRVEEEVYIAATSQSEYSRKICFMMLTMETRLQSPMLDSMQTNSAALYVNLNPLLPFDSIAQHGNRNGRDWQQEVYQKIKAMKFQYLLDLRRTRDASGSVGDPNMKSGDWRVHLQADSRQRIVNKIMDMLKRHLPFAGHEGLQELKKIAVSFEWKVYTAATTQSDYLRMISLKMLTMETRSQNPMQSNSTANSVNPSDPGSHVKQQVNNHAENPMSDPMHSNSATNSLNILVPLDSKAQTGNPNGGDWQEEVYQKIRAMKDLYLLDLNNILHKLLSRLQQLESLPQQPNNELHEKMKLLKNLLERYIQFLQIPKHEIIAIHKDKLGTYEMQIINVINWNRHKPTAPQEAQTLPSPHMQSLHPSQQTHSQ